MAIEAATLLGQARASDSAAEHARMGRVSGALWIVGALVGLTGLVLPGAEHGSIPFGVGLSLLVLAYGIGSVSGWIPWRRASLATLGVGMVVTIPAVGLAIYLTGASLSYIEPLLVCSLLYAAFFFPPRWAWPLSIELLLVAGTPLLYDSKAIDNAFLPRYIALVAAFLAVGWVMIALKRRLVEAETQQRRAANRDHLTGAGNRRAFDAVLRHAVETRPVPIGQRRGDDDTRFALLTLDLDDFKGINDRFGHQVGDAVLRATTARIRAALNSADMLARIGGDEFAVIAPGADAAAAQRLAEAIEASVLAGHDIEGVQPTAPAVGWAIYPDDATGSDALMREADQRMLDAKRGEALGGVRALDAPIVIRAHC